MTPAAEYVPLILAGPLLLLMAGEDLRKLRIANLHVLLLCAVFLAAVPVLAWPEIGARVLAAAAVFLLCLALFCAGVIAGGDVKMLPAVMLFVPAGSWTAFALGLSGAILLSVAVITVLQRASVAESLAWRALREPGKLPLGLAIATAALLLPAAEWAIR